MSDLPGDPRGTAPAAPDGPAIDVEGLRKVYRVSKPGGRGRADVVAVDDVSFAVAPGSSLAIVGESGSGKTTTARMIMGLEQPTAGRIVIGGIERGRGRLGSRERRRYGREIQIVFQDPFSSLDPRQRVRDAIDEVLRLHFDLSHAEREARIATLLDQVGLDDASRAGAAARAVRRTAAARGHRPRPRLGAQGPDPATRRSPRSTSRSRPRC